MSNDISSRQDVNQAENSEENSSNESKTWEEIEKSIGMTRDELIERSKSVIDAWKWLNGEESVRLLLGYERAGLKPGKSGYRVLKAKFPNIGFRTPEWQTWVSERCTDLPICD